MTTADYRQMLEQLKRDEGCVRDEMGNHLVYRCPAGKRTIGYGHNLEANPLPGIPEVMSEDQARRLLEADVHSVMASLEANLPWAGTLDPARYAVLVNMAFNLGVGGLLGFKTTLAKVREGDFAGAAVSMGRSRWARQVGARADRLIRQMAEGQWQ